MDNLDITKLFPLESERKEIEGIREMCHSQDEKSFQLGISLFITSSYFERIKLEHVLINLIRPGIIRGTSINMVRLEDIYQPTFYCIIGNRLAFILYLDFILQGCNPVKFLNSEFHVYLYRLVE